MDGTLRPTRAHDLLVTALGRYVHPDRRAVYSGTFLGLLDAAGIKEHAARSVLSRAVERGQLHRERAGRRSYYRLTARMHERLTSGEQRIYHEEPVLTRWDGSWTLVTFSLPETRRSDRYRLRVRLGWAGFGPLRDGLWIAPGTVDLASIVEDLELTDELSAFRSETLPVTDEQQLLRQVWDLPTIETAYTGFLHRWAGDGPIPNRDPLVRELHLVTEWRLLLRTAPRLPAALLPEELPAQDAAHRFLELHHELAAAADERYAALLERPPA